MSTKQCLVSGCANPNSKRKLCNKHYRILRETGEVVVSGSETLTIKVSPCQIEGCDRTAQAKGMCMLHYGRDYHFGDARLTSDPENPEPTVDERFWTKVKKTDGCWLWTGTTDDFGKGRFTFEDGKPRSAHRYSYMKHHNQSEPLPKRVLLRQTCGEPSCVRPDHLKLASEIAATR